MVDVLNQSKARVPHITPANASAMSALAHAAKMAKKQQLALHQEQLATSGITDKYVAKSLSRVRAQIELLHDKLDSVVSDPDASAGDLDRVAAAIERLRKVEQVLSNRPGPGNLKPSSPKQSRQPVSVDPVELPQSSTVPSVPPSQST